MIKLTYVKKTPQDVYLAFSGGLDSSALLHNLLKRRVNVTLVHVNHNTEFCKTELEFTKQMANRYGLEYKSFSTSYVKEGYSKEHFWSIERNNIFQSLDKVVLTGHNLNDAVEWYLMSTFQGTAKIMEPVNKNVIRPILSVSRAILIDYIKENNIEYLTDPTNSDYNFNLRNKVRLNLLPEVIKVFPGIYTTVKRLVIQKAKNTINEI